MTQITTIKSQSSEWEESWVVLGPTPPLSLPDAIKIEEYPVAIYEYPILNGEYMGGFM